MRMRTASTMMAATLALAACSADTPTSPEAAVAYTQGGVDMVAVCHLNTDTGAYEPLMVPDQGKAVEKHLAHGDGRSGDPIPGGFGSFTAECLGHRFVIAYTDVDPADGGFNEGVDRPISALFDANFDGQISAGDVVRVYGFPVDFEASTFGSVAVSSHVVESAPAARGDFVVVIASPYAYFEWSTLRNTELFLEENSEGEGTIVLLDRTEGSTAGSLDTIFSDQDGGATQPDRSLDLFYISESDDAFIDIEITLIN